MSRSAARPRRIGTWAEATWRGAGFLDGLLHHLRRPVTLDQARAALAARRAHRDANFLAVTRHAIFETPRSPYRRLLRHAGCEYGDLVRLVRVDGVEGALAVLFREGVYLTAAQVRGDAPVLRGPMRLTVGPRQLRSPSWLVPSPMIGPGGRPTSTRVSIYRALIQDLVVNAHLTLEARGGTAGRHGLWGFPDDAWLLWAVRFWSTGSRLVRWFSRLDPGTSPFPLHRWVARVVPRLTRWAGVPLPPLEHAALAAPAPIVDWLASELRAGRRPHLVASPSSTVQLCRLSRERGVELTGAEFTLTGEAVTPARLASIRSTGAAAVPSYGAKEAGILAYGCLQPAEADELHFYDDSFAWIRAGAHGGAGDLPDDALLVTALNRSWPYVTLNVSLGDRAMVTARRCGCPLEGLGWTWHLHTVRSFEKLKVGGLTQPGPVVRLIDELLPARFGGTPSDYQLVVHDEVVDGQERFSLLVRPTLGEIDAAVVKTMAVASLTEAGAPVASLWREPRWLTVERAAPRTTVRGKILHVHRASLPEVTE